MSKSLGPNDTVADWWTRRVERPRSASTNALTIDVEDYFQVEAFANHLPRTHWDRWECRVERNVDRILQLLSDADVRATFFTLGWVAERYQPLIRRIVGAGHELASHGFSHERADRQDPQVFLDDVSRAKNVLEDCGGVAVKGYRAATFSITKQNLWAFETLEMAGYTYSSSIYPIRHDLYGIPDAPRFAFYPLANRTFMEIPVSTVRKFGVNWPCGGGGYFRLLPYSVSASNMKAVARRDKEPCIFYFHPWEIDPHQPRIPGISLKTKLRHYTNLDKTEQRLKRLLQDFRWQRMDRLYSV
jgi:polysaccharide deacetylase family protein (PEP-CTERM system associated)